MTVFLMFFMEIIFDFIIYYFELFKIKEKLQHSVNHFK